MISSPRTTSTTSICRGKIRFSRGRARSLADLPGRAEGAVRLALVFSDRQEHVALSFQGFPHIAGRLRPGPTSNTHGFPGGGAAGRWALDGVPGPGPFAVKPS